jgi:hypothetical protein
MTTFTGTVGTADTYIDSNGPSSSFPTAIMIYVGKGPTGTVRGLLKFDLSSIPPSSTIDSGTLYVTIRSDNASLASTVCVYRQKKTWTSGATWNKYDGVNNWTSAGGFDASDCEQTEMGSITLTATETLNVTKAIPLSASYIQGWVNGSFDNNGILLKTTTEATQDQYSYWAYDSGSISYYPTIAVNYSGAGSSYGYTLILNT